MSDSTDITVLAEVDPQLVKSVQTKSIADVKVTGSSATAVKRQASLVDMFSSGSKTKAGDSGQPPAKKLKASPEKSLPRTPSTSSTSSSKIGAGGLQKLNSIPFSQTQFEASLSDENREILRLECDAMGKSWLKMLKDEITKPYFLTLKRRLLEEGVQGPEYVPLKVYPPAKDIYTWSTTPLGKIKVVIIGQDPYHGPKQAHGLCFSVRKGVTVPPSLKNIYKELKNEYPDFQAPKHGDLTAWATNGVLLLNTALTVRAGKANSHGKGKMGWETFTARVVSVVDQYGGANLPDKSGGSSGVGRGVVFIAWGAHAGGIVDKLDKNKHLILKSAHPSPFSADKGFFGNGHFKAANDWLEAKYGPEGLVDWCDLDAE